MPISSKKTEEDIYTLFKKGEEIGFSKIYYRNFDRLYAYGKCLIMDDFSVECFVQHAFLRLWEYRDQIENPGHVYNFLRHVVKKEVIWFISAPRNKFYMAMSQLSRFENYQEYMHGFDPEEEGYEKELAEHKEELYEKVERVLPFLSHKRRKVLQLCLEHEFSYMKISELTGMKHSRVVQEVKKSIGDLRTIVYGQEMKGPGKEKKNKKTISFSGELSSSQAEILRMRSEEGASFDAIAQKMDVPKSEVHKQFVIAYRLLSKMHHKEFKKSA
jgi:RNA polymerase sigma factor (sigma-70 family)